MVDVVTVNGLKNNTVRNNNQHTNNTYVSGTSQLERTPASDSVTFSSKSKKEDKSKLLKFGGIGLAIAGLGAVIYCLSQGKIKTNGTAVNDLEKLLQEKLVKSKLPEHIKFENAKTIEEARKFTKEVLGIGDVDSSFTLDVLNSVNRDLTDVVNANKGNLYMPKALRFQALDKNLAASVYLGNVNNTCFGEMCINKRFYDNSELDKLLKEDLFGQNGEQVFVFDKTQNNKLVKTRALGFVGIIPDEKLSTLIRRYYDSPERLTLPEKRILFNSFYAESDKRDIYTCSAEFINLIKNNSDVKAAGINIDVNEWIQKKNSQELIQYVTDKLGKHIHVADIIVPCIEPTTIAHEMGHIQDVGLNMSKYISQKNGINNRWGALRYFEGLSADEAKKSLPLLKEFLDNPESQNTAGKVSSYAQSGIGEFVAEVYARLVKGRKFDDDVMALYKKYNGPMLAE